MTVRNISFQNYFSSVNINNKAKINVINLSRIAGAVETVQVTTSKNQKQLSVISRSHNSQD